MQKFSHFCHPQSRIQSSMTVPALTLLLALATIQSMSQPASPHTLAEMRDRYRTVLIFAPASDPRLNQQVEMLRSHRADLIDRQIMLVPFYRKYAGGVDTEVVTFLNTEESSIRCRFHIASTDFAVILLGKDGTEKFRSYTSITMPQLNSIIDAMPMRQQEMKICPVR